MSLEMVQNRVPKDVFCAERPLDLNARDLRGGAFRPFRRGVGDREELGNGWGTHPAGPIGHRS